MSLTTEAKAAHDAALAADKAEEAAELTALRQAAATALEAVLTRPNGTVLTVTAAGLTVKRTDDDNSLVVFGDADGVLLAVQRGKDEDWVVRLVKLVGGEYETASEQLADLADLGAALAVA